jgi:hypothetical protein
MDTFAWLVAEVGEAAAHEVAYAVALVKTAGAKPTLVTGFEVAAAALLRLEADGLLHALALEQIDTVKSGAGAAGALTAHALVGAAAKRLFGHRSAQAGAVYGFSLEREISDNNCTTDTTDANSWQESDGSDGAACEYEPILACDLVFDDFKTIVKKTHGRHIWTALTAKALDLSAATDSEKGRLLDAFKAHPELVQRAFCLAFARRLKSLSPQKRSRTISSLESKKVDLDRAIAEVVFIYTGELGGGIDRLAAIGRAHRAEKARHKSSSPRRRQRQLLTASVRGSVAPLQYALF